MELFYIKQSDPECVVDKKKLRMKKEDNLVIRRVQSLEIHRHQQVSHCIRRAIQSHIQRGDGGNEQDSDCSVIYLDFGYAL